MQEMSETEIYEFITKSGNDQDSIRKNTRQLREKLADEKERRVHSLTQLDPDNQDRHEREAERIFEEKNRKIDTVLLQIADKSSVKLPLTREATLKASAQITGSRKPANVLSKFIGGVVYMYLYMIAFVICSFILMTALSTFTRYSDLVSVSFTSSNISFILVITTFLAVAGGVIKALEK